MKRISSFLSLLLVGMVAWTASAEAQIGIGIRGGFNLAGSTNQTMDSDPESQQTLTGLVVGASLEYSIDPRFSLQVEGQYVEKGAMIVSSWGGQWEQTTLRYRLTYVEFPVTLKAKFGEGDLRFYGLVGPHIGLRISADGEFETEGQRDAVDLTSLTKSFDIGLEFGGGIEYQIVPQLSAVVDARYGVGLVDVNNYRDPFTVGSWNSRDIKLTTGVVVRP